MDAPEFLQPPPVEEHLHCIQIRATMNKGGAEIKSPPATAGAAGDTVQSLDWEDHLEEEMAAHSSILAWGKPTDRGAWRAAVHGVTKSLI